MQKFADYTDRHEVMPKSELLDNKIIDIDKGWYYHDFFE